MTFRTIKYETVWYRQEAAPSQTCKGCAFKSFESCSDISDLVHDKYGTEKKSTRGFCHDSIWVSEPNWNIDDAVLFEVTRRLEGANK